MNQHKKGLGKNKKRKIIIILIGILIIIASVIFYILRINTTDLEEITNYEYDNTIENTIKEEQEENELQEEGIEIVDTSDMPTRANGYKVMGRIVLEKIGIECYIFDTSSKTEREAALKVGTVRFYGPEINEPRKSMYRRT